MMKRLSALLLLLLLLPACASRSAAPAAAPAAPSSAKYVALTFDDGPSPRCTPQLLDGLRELGAKATFFVVGCQAVKDPDIVRRIADEGHQVGNHSYDHAALDRLTPAQALADLEKNDALLRELLGDGDYWVRPPYGLLTDDEAARSTGRWTRRTGARRTAIKFSMSSTAAPATATSSFSTTAISTP